MSRGRGAKLKLKGRISGYETADFSIVNPSTDNSSFIKKSEKNIAVYKEKHIDVLKTVLLILISIFVIIFLIGILSHSNENKNIQNKDNTVADSNVISPNHSDDNTKSNISGNSDFTPTAFTQRQIDAENDRDKKLDDLLKEGWTISDNIINYDDGYITVGKKWNSKKTNSSSVIKITTGFEYEPSDQKYETSYITLKLQETKENDGIKTDSTFNDILNVYSSNINTDTLNDSIQAAYNAAINSKPYKGSLSFENDKVYISTSKTGSLINVTIDVSTSLTNN